MESVKMLIEPFVWVKESLVLISWKRREVLLPQLLRLVMVL